MVIRDDRVRGHACELTARASVPYLSARRTKGYIDMSVPPPAPEIISVATRRVACDGVGGALGHPRVWLELGEAGVAECGYCDRRFVLATPAEIPENEQFAPGVYEGPTGH